MEALGEAFHASEKLDSGSFVELGIGCSIQRHVHHIVVRVLGPLYLLLEGSFLNPLGRLIPGTLALSYNRQLIDFEDHNFGASM